MDSSKAPFQNKVKFQFPNKVKRKCTLCSKTWLQLQTTYISRARTISRNIQLDFSCDVGMSDGGTDLFIIWQP